MDKIFFDQLQLPDAKYNLEVGSGNHGEQTGKILINLEQVLIDENPDIVLVEGDTNTVLAGALAASKLHIKVGHVEAGLRSYDRLMPEELNRVLTDHASDFLFAPTDKSEKILTGEGIPIEKIFVTGNTIVDSVLQNIELANKAGNVLENYDLEQNNYILSTIHRQENVDDKRRFIDIIEGLKLINKSHKIPIIYPIHPRSKKQIQMFELNHDGIELIDPIDYFGFLQLMQNSRLVLTDSGGVQEESCILGIPCVTLRDNTERPETIDVGSNILAGTKPDYISHCVSLMMNENKKWDNPFGDGDSAIKILKILEEKI
jgi:UDP-N-acetylglucosamine 2-epimerase (non-hydrolysing)